AHLLAGDAATTRHRSGTARRPARAGAGRTCQRSRPAGPALARRPAACPGPPWLCGAAVQPPAHRGGATRRSAGGDRRGTGRSRRHTGSVAGRARRHHRLLLHRDRRPRPGRLTSEETDMTTRTADTRTADTRPRGAAGTDTSEPAGTDAARSAT